MSSSPDGVGGTRGPLARLLSAYPGGSEAASAHAHAAVLVFGVSLLLRTFNHKVLLGDEGVSSLGAWRILEGQVPHRDFFEIIPPFSFLPTALSFRIFGVNLFAERLPAFLYGVLLLLATDRLLALFTQNRWVRTAALAALVPFGVVYWPIPSHHWVATLLQLLATGLLVLWVRTGKARWACVAGGLCALACFSLQDQGGYFVAGLLLLVFPWVRPAGRAIRGFVAWAGGGVLASLPLLLWLLPRVPLGDLAYQWVTFPIHHYRTIPGHSIGWVGTFGDVFAQVTPFGLGTQPFYTLTLTALNAFFFLLPTLALASASLALSRRWAPPGEVALLAATAAAGLGTCLHRVSLTNLIWAAPLFVAPAFFGLARAWESESPRLRMMARCACALLAAVSLVYSGILFRYAAHRFNVPISSPAGTLRSNEHALAKGLQEVVWAVDAHLPDGAPLVVDGFAGLVNFLTLRPNPTPFNFFFYPAYHSDAQLHQTTARLGETPSAGVLLGRPILPSNAFHAWVLARYRPVWSNDLAVLFLPSGQAPHAAPPIPTRGAP